MPVKMANCKPLDRFKAATAAIDRFTDTIHPPSPPSLIRPYHRNKYTRPQSKVNFHKSLQVISPLLISLQ